MMTLLILARAFHFGSGMMLAGVVAFRWLVLDKTGRETFVTFLRRLDLFFGWSALGVLVSSAALFWITTADMTGTSLAQALALENSGAVLGQTKFGAVCIFRAGAILVLGVLIWPVARKQSERVSFLEIACAFLAVALLLSNSFAGHAAAGTGASLPWRIGADACHLLAASVWPTGLLFFSLFLSYARNLAEASPSICAVVRRFSDVSLFAVGVLIATGVLNAFYLVGSFAALFASSYGHVLCLKILFFGLILLIATWNRFRLVPAILHAGQEAEPLLERLRRFVLCELILAAGIVMVVAVLGVTPPPH